LSGLYAENFFELFEFDQKVSIDGLRIAELEAALASGDFYNIMIKNESLNHCIFFLSS
jgi:hypothetical protein